MVGGGGAGGGLYSTVVGLGLCFSAPGQGGG